MSQNTENTLAIATATATAPNGTEAQPLATGAQALTETHPTILIRPADEIRKLLTVSEDGVLTVAESETPINLDEVCGILTEDADKFKRLGVSLAALLRFSRKLPYTGTGSAYDYAAEKVKARCGSFSYVQNLIGSLDIIEANNFPVGPTIINDVRSYFKKRELLLSTGHVKPEGMQDTVVLALRAGGTQKEIRAAVTKAKAEFPALFPPSNSETKAPALPAPATTPTAPAETPATESGDTEKAREDRTTVNAETETKTGESAVFVNEDAETPAETETETPAPTAPAPTAPEPHTPPTDGKPVIPKDSPESISLDMHTLCGRIERMQAKHGIKQARSVWAANALELAKMAGLTGCKLAK